jgi:hypothetical protein
MRGFGTTVLKSSNLEAACDSIIDGMEFEYIYSPDVLETIVSWNPAKVARAAACENCTTLVHEPHPDDEWCGLGIYDDRVGICCHDVETGMLKAVVDTDSPDARAWAESVYERARTRHGRSTRTPSLRLTGPSEPRFVWPARVNSPLTRLPPRDDGRFHAVKYFHQIVIRLSRGVPFVSRGVYDATTARTTNARVQQAGRREPPTCHPGG